MAKKRDFSDIGTHILTKNNKPSSLSDLMNIDDHSGAMNSIKQEQKEPVIPKSSENIIRECISISRSDADMVNELSIKCAAEGQKTTKADVYRASIRYFSKLSPSVMASKIREVRKDKKTHN